ncbi:MAG: 50S ribosomal protein L13, partial [Nanoarchaeota archaeon]|nr:50S ribosomal protein L13 [Nanoarchaeota archaeon]
GKDLLLGRACTRIAKMALMNDETIYILNCEKMVISGARDNILARYRHRRTRTDAFKGPYFPRKAERIVKRCLRGMLPYKQERGLTALKKIKCYEGIPFEMQNKKMESIEGANVKKTNITKFLRVGEIAKELGR